MDRARAVERSGTGDSLGPVIAETGHRNRAARPAAARRSRVVFTVGPVVTSV